MGARGAGGLEGGDFQAFRYCGTADPRTTTPADPRSCSFSMVGKGHFRILEWAPVLIGLYRFVLPARVAQLAEAADLSPAKCGFDSHPGHGGGSALQGAAGNRAIGRLVT